MNTDEEGQGLSKEEHNQLQSRVRGALPESGRHCGGIPVNEAYELLCEETVILKDRHLFA